MNLNGVKGHGTVSQCQLAVQQPAASEDLNMMQAMCGWVLTVLLKPGFCVRRGKTYCCRLDVTDIVMCCHGPSNHYQR